MSLLSAVVAVSAHLGALGFTAGASNPSPVVVADARSVPADVVGSPATPVPPTSAAANPSHDDDAHEHGSRTAAESTVRAGGHDD
jgi:hypothetical protein